eukprot:scaffold9087_cov18-Tisochrysis_lutea.AAC.3
MLASSALLFRRCSLSLAKLRTHPHCASPVRPSMFLGSRTTRSSREQREEMKMSAHGSRTDEELQHWQRIHTTSSALDSMRSTNTSGDLHKVGGGMERERALQQFGSSGKIYPTGGTLLAGGLHADVLVGHQSLGTVGAPVVQLPQGRAAQEKDRRKSKREQSHAVLSPAVLPTLTTAHLANPSASCKSYADALPAPALLLLICSALALAPLLTKMCTAGVCTLVGDTLAQVLPFLLKSSHSSDAAAQKGSSTVDGGSGAAGKPGSGAPSGGLDQRSNSLKHP